MTDQPTYLKPYFDAQERHGTDFDVTLWASEKTQHQRFAAIAQSVFLPGKRILDAGCSRGDFAQWMLDHQIKYGRYIGIDGLPEVVEHARGRQLPDSEFHAGDLVTDIDLMRLGKPQIIVISGTLNTMREAAYMAVLNSAWRAAEQTLVFNFLSDTCDKRAPRQDYPAVRLPTLRLLQWAMSRTWKVQFRQDYFDLGHDAMIVMDKP